MPADRQHHIPVNDLDAAAREAFSACANAYDIAEVHGISPRTVERIAAGKRDVPPRLAREVGEHVRGRIERREMLIDEWSGALIAWADSREGQR